MGETTAATGLAEGIGTIITDMGSVNTFIWGLFKGFLDLFIQYPLIAFPVLFALLAAAIAVAVKIVRRFGVRGKR
mgnify:CR=1 FL=1